MRTGLAHAQEEIGEDFESFVAGEGSASRADVLSLILRRDVTTSTATAYITVRSEAMLPAFGITYRGRQYRFTKPLALKVYPMGSITMAENESLQMLTYGETRKDALASFAEAFDVLYREVVEVDAALLSEHAQSLSRALRELVSSVT